MANKLITIAGVKVKPTGMPMIVGGKTWITYQPVNDDDERCWEYCLETGKVIQTVGERD